MLIDNKKRPHQILRQIFYDPWGIGAARIARNRDQFLMRIWSVYAYLKCLYWKVSIGKGCSFWGKMYFHRTPGSTVIFGEN